MQRVAIHSVPRSGSTWLGSIFDSHPNVIYKYQPLFSYRFKDFLSATATKKEIDDFFLAISQTPDDFLDQIAAKQKGIIPCFNKQVSNTIAYKEVRYHHILKNLLESDKTIKVIGLVRNPLSVISSWLKAPKEFRSDRGWKIQEEWRYAPKKNLNKREEFNGYEKWKEVMSLFEIFQIHFPKQFCLVNYDDLLNNKIERVKSIFAFCNLDMKQQTIDFIQQSSSIDQKDAYSVFKARKKDDRWKQDLPAFIVKEISHDPDFVEINTRYHWI